MADQLRISHRPPWVDDDLFPFASRYLDIRGHRVHYVDEGQGPTLLLLHGNPTWSFVYREVITALRPTFRCVAFDYPGFGLSDAAPEYRFRPEEHAAVTAEVIEALDLDDFVLVMQDWGGPIGIRGAASSGRRVAGLVVANTWAWPVNGDLHFEMFSRIMGGAVGRELIRRLNLFVNVMIPLGHRRRTPTPAELRHYRLALDSHRRRDASAVLPHAITADRAFLEQVECDLANFDEVPSLIAWADRDIAFRSREREEWERRLTNHRSVAFTGAGHYVQSDVPHELAAAIRAWWSTRHEPA